MHPSLKTWACERAFSFSKPVVITGFSFHRGWHPIPLHEGRRPPYVRYLEPRCGRGQVSNHRIYNGRYLQVLWMIGIVRSGSTEVLQMINLVIHRHRLASIVPHLIPHLEHVVLQLLLVAQLRKKPTILCFRRIRTIFESVFHGFSRITPLTPYQWVGPTHCRETTLIMSVQRDITIKPQFINFVKCFLKKRCGLTHEDDFSSQV